MTPWPHQTRGVNGVLGAIAQGKRRICLTSPTGGGKGWMIEELVRRWSAEGHGCLLLSNRRILVEQITRRLRASGVEHGVRAAGHEDNRHLGFQVSTVQTEAARVLRRRDKGDPRAWALHGASYVVVDEAHLMRTGQAKRLQDEYVELGATVVLVTASPLGMGDVADVLIVAGNNSELRACGALVWARHYAPDEPDLRRVKVPEGREFSRPLLGKVMNPAVIFGSVFDNWKRLNPDGRATILFAPGVPESRWFAREFSRRGVSAAHIDGNSVWVNGKEYQSGREAREDVIRGTQHDRIRVVCNRFVLREGVDCPWLAHGIFATVFGSVQSYLQAGGRLLRAHPGLGSVAVQDHGGNWWRHGSLNADREWGLDLTAGVYAAMFQDGLRDRPQAQPVSCPECGRVHPSFLAGRVCGCGFEFKRGVPPVRRVVQVDGTLVNVYGLAVAPRVVRMLPDTKKNWLACYFQALNCRTKRMTFRQAVGLFVEKYHYWPPPDLPYMPTVEMDYYRAVKDVPAGRLVRGVPAQRVDGRAS